MEDEFYQISSELYSEFDYTSDSKPLISPKSKYLKKLTLECLLNKFDFRQGQRISFQTTPARPKGQGRRLDSVQKEISIR